MSASNKSTCFKPSLSMQRVTLSVSAENIKELLPNNTNLQRDLPTSAAVGQIGKNPEQFQPSHNVNADQHGNADLATLFGEIETMIADDISSLSESEAALSECESSSEDCSASPVYENVKRVSSVHKMTETQLDKREDQILDNAKKRSFDNMNMHMRADIIRPQSLLNNDTPNEKENQLAEENGQLTPLIYDNIAAINKPFAGARPHAPVPHEQELTFLPEENVSVPLISTRKNSFTKNRTLSPIFEAVSKPAPTTITVKKPVVLASNKAFQPPGSKTFTEKPLQGIADEDKVLSAIMTAKGASPQSDKLHKLDGELPKSHCGNVIAVQHNTGISAEDSSEKVDIPPPMELSVTKSNFGDITQAGVPGVANIHDFHDLSCESKTTTQPMKSQIDSKPRGSKTIVAKLIRSTEKSGRQRSKVASPLYVNTKDARDQLMKNPDIVPEAQFEQLTKELEAERRSVANQLEKCKLGSETTSMSSVSSTDGYAWQNDQPQQYSGYTDQLESDTDSRVSGSHLVDSCLRVLQERGVMDSGDGPLLHSDYNYNQKQPSNSYMVNHSFEQSPKQPSPINNGHQVDYINNQRQDSYSDRGDTSIRSVSGMSSEGRYKPDTSVRSTHSLGKPMKVEMTRNVAQKSPASYNNRPSRSPTAVQPHSIYDPYSSQNNADGYMPNNYGEQQTDYEPQDGYRPEMPHYALPQKASYQEPDSSDRSYPGPPLDTYAHYAQDPSYGRLPRPLDNHGLSYGSADGPFRSRDSYSTQDYTVQQNGSFQPLATQPSLHSSGSIDTLTREQRWRDPDLSEVVEFLTHPNNTLKTNAAAYLQHLSYGDDSIKQKARVMNALPPLVGQLSVEDERVPKAACGALRNLSYGKHNDDNKRAIKNENGIPSLIRLLRKTQDNETKELVTGVLWNMSSCEDLKKPIIDDGLKVFTDTVIIPHSGIDSNTIDRFSPDIQWSTVVRNATGILRNISSEGEYARKRFRECEGLVEALLTIVRASIGKSDIDNKTVENSVCILRNLSYRCQEIDDPNYDQHQMQLQRSSTQPAKASGDKNSGCFGGGKKKDDQKVDVNKKGGSGKFQTDAKITPGMAELWHPDVVKIYLPLLNDCSNPETLEAAAGAIQNLSACYWQPSIDIRSAVRKEKGLPLLVELLRMDDDRVVCSAVTALRNLSLDQRNKELIGKYAMKDLVANLPTTNHQQEASSDTVAAVLATLNEVIKKNSEFAQSLLETKGFERLMILAAPENQFSVRVQRFASQTLCSMWQHKDLHEAYKRSGWKESNFIYTISRSASASHSPTNENTMNRPVSEGNIPTSATWNDEYMYRSHRQQEEIPMSAINSNTHIQHGKPNEPLYAKVHKQNGSQARNNNDNKSYEQPSAVTSNTPMQLSGGGGGGQSGADSWV